MLEWVRVVYGAGIQTGDRFFAGLRGPGVKRNLLVGP